MSDAKPELAWEKMGGLLPAVVQDAASGRVLMLGYMNETAYQQTLATGRVTFFSRSRNALWVKGETSGHYLHLVKLMPDCDGDALLVLAKPEGATCHLGCVSCFDAVDTVANAPFMTINNLTQVIAARAAEKPDGSYTAKLLASGLPRIAQKVAEEGSEVALAAVTEPARVPDEAADLIYHLLVLLQATGKNLGDVIDVLQARQK
jgi:phosphoribosyl-AMP cyclohydrolase / phosphoribosyl-ATP pyrophosphohydrolase